MRATATTTCRRYRGLAGRQPAMALALAVLLLAQAGAPFTTGLWAKLQVVFAAVAAGEVPLGVIAMVTAVVAAYFYLRVAVLMYAGGGQGEAEGGLGGSAALGAEGGMTGGGTITGGDRGQRHGREGWPGRRRRRRRATVTTLNEQILLDDEAAERAEAGDDATPERVPVPALERAGHRALHRGDGALRRVATATHRLRQPRHPAVPAQVGVSPGRSRPCPRRMAATSAPWSRSFWSA